MVCVAENGSCDRKWFISRYGLIRKIITREYGIQVLKVVWIFSFYGNIYLMTWIAFARFSFSFFSFVLMLSLANLMNEFVKDERGFRAMFGGPSVAIELLFCWVMKKYEPSKNQFSGFSLLLMLNFLKDPGANWSSCASRWKLDPRTIRRRVEIALRLVDGVLPEFNLDDKHVNWPYSVPSGIIDTFSTKVEQPKEESWEYLQGKNSFGFKYEIVCSIGVPRIIWLSGPWKGAASDVTIAELSGVKEELKDEALLADKIYRGDKISFIVPHSGHRYSLSEEKRAYNYLVYSARQSIERVIRRMKVFGIFHIVWKYSASFHALCTKVIGKLVNLFLIFEPLG